MVRILKIYTIDGCGFCKRAIELLNNNNIHHSEIHVADDDKDFTKKQNGMDTFPQIFIITPEVKGINGSEEKIYRVGGYHDLEKRIDEVKQTVSAKPIDKRFFAIPIIAALLIIILFYYTKIVRSNY